MKNEYCADLNDLLQIFEEKLSVSDIIASRVLGEISATVVKQRIDLGMTQKQFAQHMGVSQSMISKWEGSDYNFSVKALLEIASKLDLNLKVQFYKNEVEEISKKTPRMNRIISMKPQLYMINNSNNKLKKMQSKQYIEKLESLKIL